jgi:hypothetical protein
MKPRPLTAPSLDLRTTSLGLRPGNASTVWGAETVLKNAGVAYRRVNIPEPGLQILPTRNGRDLNERAADLSEQQQGMSLIYAPSRIDHHTISAVHFAEDGKYLLLSRAELESTRTGPVFEHEEWHAKSDVDSARGLPVLLEGSFVSSTPGGLGEVGYVGAVNLSEVPAYIIETGVRAEAILAFLDQGQISRAFGEVRGFQGSAELAFELAIQNQLLTQELAKLEATNPQDIRFEVSGARSTDAVGTETVATARHDDFSALLPISGPGMAGMVIDGNREGLLQSLNSQVSYQQEVLNWAREQTKALADGLLAWAPTDPDAVDSLRSLASGARQLAEDFKATNAEFQMRRGVDTSMPTPDLGWNAVVTL